MIAEDSRYDLLLDFGCISQNPEPLTFVLPWFTITFTVSMKVIFMNDIRRKIWRREQLERRLD